MMRSRMNGLLAMLLVAAVVLGVMPAIKAIKAQPSLPAMWMEPTTVNFNTNTTSNGTLFNATLYAGTTSDIFAYNWGILYDTSQLAVVAGAYTGPGGAKSQFVGSHATSSSGPDWIDVPGEVIGGESLLGADVLHATNGSVAWITFQIIAVPDPGNTLTSLIDPNTVDSYFLDPNLSHVPGVSFDHTTYTFTAPGGPPPPTRHDVVVSSVTPASNQVNQGQTLSIQVVVLNNGTVTETFDTNATYDGTLIGTQTATSLAANNTQTLTFNWNTAGVAAGNYTITATAVPVAGETDLSNNAKTAAVQVIVPRHDVVVSSVTPASNQVNQGQTLSIQVVVLNNGTVTETFDTNATYDGTLIGTQTATSLAANNTQTLTFNWNTAGVAAGNYTITATATPPAGQTDLSNIFKNATVQVLPSAPSQNPYDLDGDHNPHGTDINDIAVIAKAYGSSQSNPLGRWNPKADVYGPNGVPDGKVDLFDVAIVAKNFGKPE